MRLVLFAAALFLFACHEPTGESKTVSVRDYFNYGDTGVQSAGIRMIPITTPVGNFKVWTKRIGNNPKIKVLLLHGGPASGHEYMECFESFFPKEGIEFYEYDQLGASYSDQPTDSSLWTIDHFVDEVEQVRQALHLDKDNFYLLGHSWGGILAMEYALKHQDHLKGLIISNMMASCPAYGKYAGVLEKGINPVVLDSIRAIERRGDYTNPRYMDLLTPNFYHQHFCRLQEWPDPVNRSGKHVNYTIYTMMQGPSELGVSGRLKDWDRWNDLPKITVPTLTIGGKYDTMDPAYMEKMSKQVKQGNYLYCPNGSHLSMWDDQQTYMNGVIGWIKKVNGD